MTRAVNVVANLANYVLNPTLDDGCTSHSAVAPEALLAETTVTS